MTLPDRLYGFCCCVVVALVNKHYICWQRGPVNASRLYNNAHFGPFGSSRLRKFIEPQSGPFATTTPKFETFAKMEFEQQQWLFEIIA